jgi:hypothetical protein
MFWSCTATTFSFRAVVTRALLNSHGVTAENGVAVAGLLQKIVWRRCENGRMLLSNLGNRRRDNLEKSRVGKGVTGSEGWNE